MISEVVGSSPQALSHGSTRFFLGTPNIYFTLLLKGQGCWMLNLGRQISGSFSYSYYYKVVVLRPSLSMPSLHRGHIITAEQKRGMCCDHGAYSVLGNSARCKSIKLTHWLGAGLSPLFHAPSPARVRTGHGWRVVARLPRHCLLRLQLQDISLSLMAFDRRPSPCQPRTRRRHTLLRGVHVVAVQTGAMYVEPAANVNLSPLCRTMSSDTFSSPTKVVSLPNGHIQSRAQHHILHHL